jgi:hypothetical protein
MRSIGCAQHALDLLLARVTDPSRKTFGKYLYEHGTFAAIICRLLLMSIFKVLSLRTLQSLAPR